MTVVAAGGAALRRLRRWAPRTPPAPRFTQKEYGNTEDPQSVGVLVRIRRFQHAGPGRPHVEQGVRSRVPVEPDWHGGCLRGVDARERCIGVAATAECDHSADRGGGERRAEGWRGVSVEDHEGDAASRGRLAVALRRARRRGEQFARPADRECRRGVRGQVAEADGAEGSAPSPWSTAATNTKRYNPSGNGRSGAARERVSPTRRTSRTRRPVAKP